MDSSVRNRTSETVQETRLPEQPSSRRSPNVAPLSRWIRDLHLYLGLFVSPFVLVFATSVFFLVHNWLPKALEGPAGTRSVSDLPLPENLAQLSGRERIDALKPALERAQVYGEVGWIQHLAKENRLVIPVTVPGRLATVTIDVVRREATIREQTTGLADALVLLHKSPGPHLAAIRMNWPWMRLWFWVADATVYLVLFITVSGVYLWYLVRAQRRIGMVLMAAGAVSFFSLVYAIVH
jgi:hypothetical protein